MVLSKKLIKEQKKTNQLLQQLINLENYRDKAAMIHRNKKVTELEEQVQLLKKQLDDQGTEYRLEISAIRSTIGQALTSERLSSHHNRSHHSRS